MLRTPISIQHSPAAPAPYSDIREQLLRALPRQKDIEILLPRVQVIHSFDSQRNYKCGTDVSSGEVEPVPDLRKPDSHPILLARQMLLFASALQQIPSDESFAGLSKPHHALMHDLADTAIRLVNTNEALAGPIEGLENFVIEYFYHINSGNMRRAWLTIRRTVAAAQLLGLHRPGHYRFSRIDHRRNVDAEEMWSSIECMERVLSLLLGLPTSTSDVVLTLPVKTHTSRKGNLASLLANITAKILRRNQLDPSIQAMNMTNEIDQELIGIAGQMPPSFWQQPSFSGIDKHSTEAVRESSRAFDHMCYYILVIQLHLPHMLCPNDASQRLYSKIACVNASREILTREIALRTFDPLTPCCRMNDFLALIAGLTLMLAYAVSHCGQNSERLLTHQRLSDRATVERALECMKSISELHEDVLATRTAALLKDLLEIEEEAAQAHHRSSTGLGHANEDTGEARSLLIMRVPFVGAIKISRHGITAVPLGRMEQDQGAHEDVSIGGIGSINSTRRASPQTIQGQRPLGAAYGQIDTVPQDQHVPRDSHQRLDDTDLFSHQAEMYPDAAAGLDDWVFQGMDTAFFDTLLRGTEDLANGGIGAGVWD